MKQTLVLFILVVAMFTGCGQTQAAKDNVQNQTDTTTSTAADSSQTSEHQKDQNTIMGKVTAVNGTNLTLALAEKPEQNGTQLPQEQAPKDGNGVPSGETPNSKAPRNNASSAADSQKPSTPADSTSSKDKPNRTPPSGAKAEMSFGDQTQTVSVSDSTVITSGIGDKAETTDISSITVGSLLHITLSDDGTTAKTIQIMK